MRLVNTEFYRCLSGYYLRQLVIHVGPDLCAALNTGLTTRNARIADVAHRLVEDSNALRYFGDQVTRFALALELREYELASPKVQGDEVLEVRPWGLYRWPRGSLPSEQTPLQMVTERLENSEDLFPIIHHLKNVQELALSCEGGLGYLQGPDLSTPPRRPIIFGAENDARAFEPPYKLDFQKPLEQEAIEQLLHDAQFPAELVPKFTEGILKEEGINLEQIYIKSRSRCPLPAGRTAKRPTKPGESCCGSRMRTLRLQPDMLTKDQKRFLLQRKYHCRLYNCYELELCPIIVSVIPRE